MEEAPKVGMRWRPEFVRGIAKHDGKFIIVPEMGNIFKNDAAALASLEAEERT
jgi:purine-binding chemotaxis protein CheW